MSFQFAAGLAPPCEPAIQSVPPAPKCPSSSQPRMFFQCPILECATPKCPSPSQPQSVTPLQMSFPSRKMPLAVSNPRVSLQCPFKVFLHAQPSQCPLNANVPKGACPQHLRSTDPQSGFGVPIHTSPPSVVGLSDFKFMCPRCVVVPGVPSSAQHPHVVQCPPNFSGQCPPLDASR